MLDKDLIAKLDMKSPAVWVATWFGCGLIKGAPGTWGTIGAMPFGIAFLIFGGIPLLGAAFVVACVLGWWAADRFDKIANTHDASAIVIDEVAGVWLALMFVPSGFVGYAMAFILFRFFDVLKPWPISWCDKNIKGASGVMIDDLLAGLVAGLWIWGANYAGLI